MDIAILKIDQCRVLSILLSIVSDIPVHVAMLHNPEEEIPPEDTPLMVIVH